MKNIYIYCLFFIISEGIYSQNEEFYNIKMDYDMFLNFDGYKEYSSTLLFNKNKSKFLFSIKKKSDDENLIQDKDDGQNILFKVTDSSKYYIKTNKLENVIFQLEKGFKDEKYLLVKENIPQIKWRITDSVKIISSYKCFKALGSFAGRDYIVWFSPKLPAFFGPWKLHGLPGAILEAHDNLNEVSFICSKIKNVKHPITEIKNIGIGTHKIITREEYIKSLSEFANDLANKINTKVKRGFEVKIKSPKYNTIEKY
jgi:GLPGLI family protein